MATDPTAPSCPEPPRGRGRPRDPGLRERILQAARQVFMEQGAGVSLDRVAEAAGTSKVTVYSYFGSKEALFNAALTHPFVRTYTLARDHLDPHDPRSALLQVAEGYLDLATDADLIAQMHVLYEGAAKAPGIACGVYEAGPHAMTQLLAGWLAQVPTLAIDDPLFAAEQFLSMARGSEQTRLLLGLSAGRQGDRRRAYLESCVTLFLRGYARAG